MRWLLVAVTLSFAVHVMAQEDERCPTARDLTVRALERAQTGDAKEIENGFQLLQQATSICNSLGDTWYYLSLFQRKLGKSGVELSLKQARILGSEKMDAGADPFTLTTPRREHPLPPVRQKWALVVGIQQYQDTSLNTLKYSVNDAKSFANALTTSAGFSADHVRTLMNQDATTKTVKEVINWLARSAAPEDLVVIYIAAHGSSHTKDTAGLSYVLTYDAEVDSQDRLYATALPMVDISEAVRSRIRAERVVVILDTCHSGAATATRTITVVGATEGDMQRTGDGSGRIVIASAGKNQKAWESDALKHGYFTHFLVQNMAKHAHEPVPRIFDLTKSAVTAQVQKDVDVSQVPVMVTSAGAQQVTFSEATSR